MKKKKKPDLIYEAHKFDKEKLEMLFEEDASNEKKEQFIETLSKDLSSKLKINVPKKAQRKSTQNKHLNALKKQFPPAKKIERQEPILEKEEKDEHVVNKIIIDDVIKTKKSKVDKTLTKVPETKKKAPKKMAFGFINKSKELLSQTIQKTKQSIKALKPKSTKSAKKEPVDISKNLKSNSGKESEKGLKERESKIADLTNSKGNVT